MNPFAQQLGDERRVRMIIASVVVVLVAVILANLGYTLVRQRQAVLSGAEQRTQNLVRVIEEQARGGVDAVDVTLASIARVLQLLPGRREPRNAGIHALLGANLRNLPFVRAIWVLDPQGNMIHDSDNLPGSYNLSDREYFRVHLDDPAGGLYIDPPILSRLGVWFVGASRRIDNPDGSFAGVVAAALEPRYFDQFYDSIKVGSAGIVALMRPDGSVITRAPAGQDLRGKKLDPPPFLVDRLLRSDSGSYRTTSSFDGTERIYTYRKIKDRPLVVLVGLGVAESLAAWRATVLAQSLASTAFILVIAWLGYLVLRELHRRKRAQALVEGQKQALELIASGAPLRLTLGTLVKLIEAQSPEMIGSILLLDDDGVRLRHGAAPSLPEAFTTAIDGEPIGERAGSCGTAAFRRAPVVVEDIDSDPLWTDYRELALQHGLRACWSTPIFDRHERLVGTFAMYFRAPRRPSERDLRLIETATSTAGIAIGRQREEQELRFANERLQALSTRLLEVQEKERATIARELHDQLGQSLTALKLSAGALARTLRGPDAERMAQHVAITDRALVQVRTLALDLRPPQLDQLGLAAALRDALERMAEDTGLETGFVDGAEGSEPEKSLATAVFRIAQEALTNVARHAEARRVVVELRAQDGELLLAVFDDGRGYDHAAARARAIKGASMGILGMEERVALAGGRLQVVTRPGRGTRVEAAFPLGRVAKASAA